MSEGAEAPTLEPFVRAKKGCLKLVTSPYWGSWYKQVDDPKGKDIDTKELLEQFWIKESFNKVPLEQLRRIVTFYRRYVSNVAANSEVDTNEVQVLLLRSETDITAWKVLVPKQIITAATVEAVTHPCCDLETGEDHLVFPPEGWAHAGSSHSHNTLEAFFSGKDDRGELTVPGLHFVIGRITTSSFHIKASIVMNRIRFIVRPEWVLEIGEIPYRVEDSLVGVFTDSTAVPYAEKVETYVKRASEAVPKRTSPPSAYGSRWSRNNTNHAYSWTPKGRSPNALGDFSDLLGDVDKIGLYSSGKTVQINARPQPLNVVVRHLNSLLDGLKYNHSAVVLEALVNKGFISKQAALVAAGEAEADTKIQVAEVWGFKKPNELANQSETTLAADQLDTTFALLASLLKDLSESSCFDESDAMYGLLYALNLINLQTVYNYTVDLKRALNWGVCLAKRLPSTFNGDWASLEKLAVVLGSLIEDDKYRMIVYGILLNLECIEAVELPANNTEIEMWQREAAEFTNAVIDLGLESITHYEPDWTDRI